MDWIKEPLDPSKLNITARPLHQPSLDELMNGNYEILWRFSNGKLLLEII